MIYSKYEILIGEISLFFKKKVINSDGNCSNCEHAKINSASDDVLCHYYGIVSPGGICKKYKKNLLAYQPPKKRSINTDFTPEDFSIE